MSSAKIGSGGAIHEVVGVKADKTNEQSCTHMLSAVGEIAYVYSTHGVIGKIVPVFWYR